MAEEEHDSDAPLDDQLGPLPAGRHGYTPEEVAHNQRERLLAAVVEVVDQRGYDALTVTDITTAASVARRVFYENFADKEASFLAAFDVIVEHLREIVLAAAEPEPDWPHQLLAALRRLLEFLASEPLLARFLLVESIAAGAGVTARYREAVHSFAPYLRAGRDLRPKRQLPASTEDSLLGALASLLGRALANRDPLDVPRLTVELSEFILTPYIGAKRAAQVAEEAAAGRP